MNKENKKIEELSQMELIRLIYKGVKSNSEEIKNVRKELNEKIDNIKQELLTEINDKFKYLDERIDNTKQELAKEIAEEFKNITNTTSKLINNIENKLNNEIEDRKVDVSKVKEFNRIILNDIRGRVSILEEESEKYNVN